MTIAWYFNEARPGDRARESQVEKFFNSDAVANRANAIVREGIQNSLDAAPDWALVLVRIGFGLWPKQQVTRRLPTFTPGFDAHFEAVIDKIADPPTDGDEFRYLVFEDFNTSGLLGDPAQWWLHEGRSNPFFNFFRAEGISDKEHGNRGRHGVGKFVFAAASRTRTVFGLTQREDGRQLLMGTTVLRNHWVNQKPYLPDGWFGIHSAEVDGLILPVEEDTPFIEDFKSDFGVTRADENGLSIMVPWLDTEVTPTSVVEAVIRGYFYPIMRSSLIVDVIDESGHATTINAATIRAVAASYGNGLAAEMRPVLDLAEASLARVDPLLFNYPSGDYSPKWTLDCIPEDARRRFQSGLESGEMLAIRALMVIRPKNGQAAEGSFKIFLHRDKNADDGQIIFIREGIIVTDARPRRTPGIRGLVVIDEGPLATFLGDSENPSHTQWQKELVKDRYTYAVACLDYVVQSVPSILRLISDEQKKPDPSLLIDLFSLRSDSDVGPKDTEKKPETNKGNDIVPPPNLPTPKPKPFVIQHVDGGFAIRRGSRDTECPGAIEVKVAYDVRRGNPLKKYDPADFELDKGTVRTQVTGATIISRGDNILTTRIDDDNFEIRVTGFDTNRDLHIRARVIETETGNAEAA